MVSQDVGCFLRLVYKETVLYIRLCWTWKELIDKLRCFFVSVNIVHT